MANSVTYGSSQVVWLDYNRDLESLVDQYQLKKICDVGGGANPTLSSEFVRSRNLDYTVMDISQQELDKAPAEFRKSRQDILELHAADESTYDFILHDHACRTRAYGQLRHSNNIYRLLNPGGLAVHFFPTLYSLAFMVNRLIPETMASWLLDSFAARNRHKHEQFPAYYDWCRGATHKMLNRVSSVGYEILEYRGLYGHDGYYRNIPIASAVHRWLCRLLLKHPHFTSYAFVILQKPGGQVASNVQSGAAPRGPRAGPSHQHHNAN